ncbi:MAG: hypothetical protein JWN70_1761 [Planctomycetaceae bacterium]|nr:hypothetical protein [Planctomycetaceae bacterium]
MLNIYSDRPSRHCDGLSRRGFLQIGSLAVGGLTLPDLLRYNAVAGESGRRKSIIMICLGGGPSHLDMYDMRPAAPLEYRGEFLPVASKIPGMDMCELMPRQAEIADRFAVVRSLQWTEPCHQFNEICTGFPVKAERPSFGSIVNRIYPGGSHSLPRFVDLAGDSDKLRAEEPRYVGTAFRSFRPNGPDIENLVLPRGVSLERLGDRKQLRTSLDRLRRDIDASGQFLGVDAFARQALDIVTSNSVRQAFDITQEPPELVARYGDKKAFFRYLGVQYGFDFESFIRARRLVEAGVPFVSLNVARWDHHCLVAAEGSIFDSYRTLLPLYDMAVAALINDLHERGLSQDVAVVVWGEFGRTPRVNKTGGRDHWPSSGSALIAGGGLKMGQYVGQTDRRAERPSTRPYGPQNLLATLYYVLGIDPESTIRNGSGRPMYLLDDRDPIRELM